MIFSRNLNGSNFPVLFKGENVSTNPISYIFTFLLLFILELYLLLLQEVIMNPFFDIDILMVSIKQKTLFVHQIVNTTVTGN